MTFQDVIDAVEKQTDGAFGGDDVLFWCNELLGIIDAEINIPQFVYKSDVLPTDEVPIPIAYQSVFVDYCMKNVGMWQRDKDVYDLYQVSVEHKLSNYASFLRRQKTGIEVNSQLYDWI